MKITVKIGATHLAKNNTTEPKTLDLIDYLTDDQLNVGMLISGPCASSYMELILSECENTKSNYCYLSNSLGELTNLKLALVTSRLNAIHEKENILINNSLEPQIYISKTCKMVTLYKVICSTMFPHLISIKYKIEKSEPLLK